MRHSMTCAERAHLINQTAHVNVADLTDAEVDMVIWLLANRGDDGSLEVPEGFEPLIGTLTNKGKAADEKRLNQL